VFSDAFVIVVIWWYYQPEVGASCLWQRAGRDEHVQAAREEL
jgi:hypothetical protein